MAAEAARAADAAAAPSAGDAEGGTAARADAHRLTAGGSVGGW